MNNAIFFDRDDTLIKDSGYMFKPEDLEFFKDTFEVLKKLQDKNYLLFIVTNQSGIGRGFFNEEDMQDMEQRKTITSGLVNLFLKLLLSFLRTNGQMNFRRSGLKLINLLPPQC